MYKSVPDLSQSEGFAVVRDVRVKYLCRRLLILFLFNLILGCNSTKEDKERTSSVVDSTNIKVPNTFDPNTILKDTTSQDNTLHNFLRRPFDHHRFKEVKLSANSGGGGKNDYWFEPNENGFYYNYFLFQKHKHFTYRTLGQNILRKQDARTEGGFKFIVFKKDGPLQQYYQDSTELLISFYAEVNDEDLPEMAFIGLDTNRIKTRLGNPTFRKKGFFIYSDENKVLIVNHFKNRVNWVRYVVLKEGTEPMLEEDLFKNR